MWVGIKVDRISEMVLFDRNLIHLSRKLHRDCQYRLIQLDLPLS
jgi:hypothetical protein